MLHTIAEVAPEISQFIGYGLKLTPHFPLFELEDIYFDFQVLILTGFVVSVKSFHLNWNLCR